MAVETRKGNGHVELAEPDRAGPTDVRKLIMLLAAGRNGLSLFSGCIRLSWTRTSTFLSPVAWPSYSWDVLSLSTHLQINAQLAGLLRAALSDPPIIF